MKDKKSNIIDILNRSSVVFYDYQDNSIPEALINKKIGKIDMLPWMGIDTEESVKFFLNTGALYLHDAEVCFLDNRGLKLMMAGFPDQYQYFFLRLALRKSWALAFLGLMRRILKRQVKLLGIIALNSLNKNQKWLVIENVKLKSINGSKGRLSGVIGIQGFLDFLRKEKIKYVVPRFYEKLPHLYRKGGDIDILVADEDEIKIKNFLNKHPGRIRIDIWSVSTPNYRQMTYYPPHLARNIINNSIDGPGGSKIPNLKEAFLSFAYHALYHKGLSSGIPSTITNIKVNLNPENDYVGILSSMAKKLGIDIVINMESLDEYLHKEGWRPKLDTLKRFVLENEWILQRFFAHKNWDEIGLGFFVFKEKAVNLNLVEKMIKVIENEHFVVIYKKKFNLKEKIHASEQLRGGFWSGKEDLKQEFLPALGVVVIDTLLKERGDYDIADARLRKIKDKLRSRFDSGKESLVHATDNTYESLEYIKICFPDKINEIKNEIKNIKIFNGFLSSIKRRIVIYKAKMYYYKNITKIKLRDAFIRLIVN